MRVWILSERQHGELGATRWEVEWWVLRPDKAHKSRDEINFDSDLEAHYTTHPNRDAAIAQARKVAPDSFFGGAMVKRQTLNLIDGTTADWDDDETPPPEEIT